MEYLANNREQDILKIIYQIFVRFPFSWFDEHNVFVLLVRQIPGCAANRFYPSPRFVDQLPIKGTLRCNASIRGWLETQKSRQVHDRPP